jgi:competence protein ComEC
MAWAHGFARRRRAHLALTCAVAGLAGAPFGTVPALVAAALAAALAASTLGGQAALAAVALVMGAATLGAIRLAAIDRPAHAAAPGTAIDADATMLDAPRPARFGSTATLSVDTGPARGLHVFARGGRASWPRAAGPGMRVRLRGVVLDPDRRPAGLHAAPSEANAGVPGTPGFGPLPAERSGPDDFDFAAFLRSRGVGRELRVESMRPIGRRGGLAGFVDSIRRRAELGIGAGLGADRAALARGMVLGEDGQVPDDVRDDFRRSGLAHLLAASGQNVALLFALVLPLLMLARAGPRTRVAALLVLVALYVPLAGAGASVQRAGIMAAAALVALAAGRPASAAYALLLAAAVTLALNPRASGDPGWQLSFAAVTGMLLLEPHARGLVRRVPRIVAAPIAASVAATLATAPVMAHEFGRVSLAALPANLVAVPAVAPIMWIGMAQAAVAQASALGGAPAQAALGLCRIAGELSALGLRWVAGVAHRFAEPGWAQAQLHMTWLAVAAAYGGIAAACALSPRAARRMRAALAAAASRGRIGEALDHWRALPRRSRRAGIVLAAAMTVAAGAALAARPPGTPHALTIDFLDVGQGDATLIRDPAGAAVLFDGGPPEARIDLLLHRLGVHRLSVVVATHVSRDHHGGLRQVIERFPVGLFLDGGDGTRDRSFVALERAVDRRHVRRIAARAGENLRIGALAIKILWPTPRGPGEPPPANANMRAVTAIVSEAGFRVFLSADAESPVLLPLRLPGVDVMKVPHHGSADPGLPQLLQRLHPTVAAIEVGRGNDYGHPQPSTLAALRNAHVPLVYRTDRDGTIELSVSRGRIAVRTHR